jgi:hypothetical protein
MGKISRQKESSFLHYCCLTDTALLTANMFLLFLHQVLGQVACYGFTPSFVKLESKICPAFRLLAEGQRVQW